eukprot:6532564-Karenia_brevis.AAC.1
MASMYSFHDTNPLLIHCLQQKKSGSNTRPSTLFFANKLPERNGTKTLLVHAPAAMQKPEMTL